MITLHVAWGAEPLGGGRVRCTLCPRRCRIADGTFGTCGVRANRGGTLYTLAYDRVAACELDPIEKKPLYHFHPGSTAYSIATVGCCLACENCQNWGLSQWPQRRHPRRFATAELYELAMGMPGVDVTPAQLVEDAIRRGARSIAYTYTEPTVFYELAYDTALAARAAGLCNVWVTSGYTSPAALRRIAPLLDGVNVDLKFARDDTYHRITGAHLEPVLDAIRLYRSLGVWTEVTTLLIPGLNDSDVELRDLAEMVRSIGPEVPWHVTRFHPAHRMLDRGPTPLETLVRARQIGRAAGLEYVYVGNVPGVEGEHTTCAGCGARLIERHGMRMLRNRVVNGCCPDCQRPVEGFGMDGDLVGAGAGGAGSPGAPPP